MEDVMRDIRLSQIGYGRFIPARVVLLNDTKATLKDMKGNVIKTVCCEETRVDAASGDHAAICDLGTLDEGEYLFAAVHDTEKISVNKDTYKSILNEYIDKSVLRDISALIIFNTGYFSNIFSSRRIVIFTSPITYLFNNLILRFFFSACH